MAATPATQGLAFFGGLTPQITYGREAFAAIDPEEVWHDDGASVELAKEIAARVHAYGATQVRDALADAAGGVFFELATDADGELVIGIDLSSDRQELRGAVRLIDLFDKAISEAGKSDQRAHAALAFAMQRFLEKMMGGAKPADAPPPPRRGGRRGPAALAGPPPLSEIPQEETYAGPTVVDGEIIRTGLPRSPEEAERRLKLGEARRAAGIAGAKLAR
jgi:hypothetical protein